MLQVGKKAPDFNMANESGDTVTLSDFRGSRTLIFFYAKDNTSG